MPGAIILINGASSAGKSTLSRALQARLERPFWHYSIDHFRGDVLPWKRIQSREFEWAALRPAFFDGFHRCLPALALAGNDLIVEHIVETGRWMSDLVQLLDSVDVYFVGLHCPLEELERRERARGDRPLGDARRDFESIHLHCTYDLELDSTAPLGDNVEAVLNGWHRRGPPSAFERMRADGMNHAGHSAP